MPTPKRDPRANIAIIAGQASQFSCSISDISLAKSQLDLKGGLTRRQPDLYIFLMRGGHLPYRSLTPFEPMVPPPAAEEAFLNG